MLASCHELPFTAHQCVRETVGFIVRKYWWGPLRDDVSSIIKNLITVQKWKTGRRTVAPLGDILVAQEFFDVVCVDVLGPLPLTEKGKWLFT